jgi:hypothetical protein
MRRILLFLAVFGVGSAVLWYFESERRAHEAARSQEKAVRDPRGSGDPLTTDGPPGPAVRGAPPDGRAPGDVSADGTRAGADAVDGLPQERVEPVSQMSGYLNIDWPGTGTEPNLQLDVDDLQPTDERAESYVAEGVRITARERVEGGAPIVRETVEAASGTFKLKLAEGLPVGLADDSPVSLKEVKVVRHQGAIVVPLELRAPRLEAYPNRGRYESVADDLVEIEGPGLDGSGRSLVYDGLTRRLVLGRSADVSFVLEDRRVVEFWTTGNGPLELTRPTDDILVAVAEGGARLELLGDPPAMLDAQRIEVTLRTVASGGLVIESARAHGAVVVTQGDDRFTGDTALVQCRNGELSKVVLNDAPEARVTLRAEDGEDLDVIISGQGPLDVDVVRLADEKRRATFVFLGPGQVQVPAHGLVVTFEERVEARAREDLGRAIFVAAGGVVVRRADVRIDTESLTATVLGDTQAEAVEEILVVTEGPTILRGRTEEGANVRVDAELGLTARLVDVQQGADQGPDPVIGGRWLLDRAEGVTFATDGADPFRVEAGLLLEGDLTARTFKVEDTVKYHSPLGEVTAQRGTVRGRERVELLGDAGAPARIVLAPNLMHRGGALTSHLLESLGAARAGELTALAIELTDTTLDAHGDARGHLVTLEGRLELDADRVRLTRVVPAVTSAAPETATLVAEGVRRAELIGKTSQFRVAARRVVADGIIETRPAAPGAPTATSLRITEVDANGAVVLGSVTVDGRLDVDADEIRLTRGGEQLPDEFHVNAHRVTRGSFEHQGRAIRAACLELDVRGRFIGDVIETEGSVLVATGDVWVEDTGPTRLEARCERLELRDGKRAELHPAPGKRITASGVLPARSATDVGVPYSLEADRIIQEPELLEAFAPELRLDEVGAALQVPSGIVLTRASAGHMLAVPDLLTFDGGFQAEGRDKAGTHIEMSAGSITARPKEPLRAKRTSVEPTQEPSVPKEGEAQQSDRAQAGAPETGAAQERRELPFEEFQFTGGFDMTYGGMRVRAETASAAGTQLRLTGWKDEPAILESDGYSIEATWLIFDAEEFLVSAGRGILRSPPGPGEWSLGFASIEPRVQDDESLAVIASPRLVRGSDEARADWISIWLLRDAWRAKGAAALYDEGEPPPPPPPSFAERDIPGPDLLAEALLGLQQKEFAAYVRALYAEGDIEVEQGGRRASRADALYLDVGEASGWLSEAELVQRVEAGSRSELIRIRAGRLETDGSGRLVASRATLTTCDHDNPHYVVLTQRLALEPRADGRWRFGARGNRLRFANGLQVPLPSLGNAVLDERGDFEGFESDSGEVTPLNNLTIAQTARFGASVGASFGFEAGRFGRWLGDLFGMDTNVLRGRWDTEAKYLGDRGPLVSAKLDLRERKPRDDLGEDFRMEFFVSGIPDSGEDKGVERVAESEREEQRIFGWFRGRYPIVRGEWIDAAFSGQTDPGVQAEFFEGDFIRWDERDTYIRWRKSRDGTYYSIGVSKRVDSFRSQVEELPSFGAELGQREVASLGAASLLYGGSIDVAQLRRLEGEPGRDPFSVVPGGESLGLDGRETARANLNQRFDLAVPTRFVGAKAVPFVELDATGWTENQAEDDDVTRFAILGGIDLTTVLHSTEGGYTSVLAPHVGARTDLVYEERGGPTTPFDSLERPIDGDVYEAGVRGLWSRVGTFENLDVDLRVIRTEDRGGVEDMTEIGLLGEWITRVGGSGGGRVGLLHDGRYEADDGETTYSNSTLAWGPNDIFLIEGRYARARALDGSALYEATGIDARWTLDPKWELEVRHTWSLQGEGSLDTGIAIRRFAHDFLFEFGVSKRAGEGGTSFGISFNPLLAWKKPQLGILDRR